MRNLKWDACNALWGAKVRRQLASSSTPAPAARPTPLGDGGNARVDDADEMKAATSKVTGRPPRPAERDDA